MYFSLSRREHLKFFHNVSKYYVKSDLREISAAMIPVATNLERRKFPAVTLALIGVNILVFIIEVFLSDDALLWVFQNLGFGPATRNPFAPVAAIFLHGDIYHIAFNMLFLWVFGSPVEERVGSRNFLIYYFGAGLSAGLLGVTMEMIARPDSITPGIGASGAVSGIMALFLYRCFYSKLKMVISPILLPRQINVPVIPLVLFWFFQDVIMGVVSMSHVTGVGHWTHVGGFIFGIAVGRIKRYGHEGRVEQIKEKIVMKLEKGGGWRSAEKEYLKLLEISPEDPELQHDLARLYANSGQPKLAEKHYRFAAQKFFLREPEAAAYIVLEHSETLSKPMEVQYLLRASNAFLKMNEVEDAYKVLLPVINYGDYKGPLMEQSLVLLAKLCRHLDKTEEAMECINIFTANFPGSISLNEIKNVMNMGPAEVFSHLKTELRTLTPEEKKKVEIDEGRMSKIELFERVFADPVFWSIMLFAKIASPFLLPHLYHSRLYPLYLFAASFVMSVIHRMGSITDILSIISAHSDKKIRNDVNLQRSYDEAALAAQRAMYPEAATLYEKLLQADPRNIQARYNLARIYDKQLSNGAKARGHYRALMKSLPPEHPYYRDSVDAVKGKKCGIDLTCQLK